MVKESFGKPQVQFGRTVGICVEKNSQLPKGDLKRKYKCRVVFHGSEVKNQYNGQAIFYDVGGAPTTLDSAGMCDCYGSAPGDSVQRADAERAYVQASTPQGMCWIEIPREWRPESTGWVSFGVKPA